MSGSAAHKTYCGGTRRDYRDDLQGKERYTFKWLAGMGYLSQPAGKFKLMLGEQPLVGFEVVEKTAKWKSPDGAVELDHEVRQAGSVSTSLVVPSLTLPSALLRPGQEAELRVVPQQNGSLRWVSVYEPDLAYLARAVPVGPACRGPESTAVIEQATTSRAARQRWFHTSRG